ncbi:uncharacterized protein B0P05DRAFT_570147 [Gilbertella persicaria]|uniref:uncharacterized protein n=1 Tax=Gilbertella persicaria TaxID=101096 RepID=UPI00221F54A3|nr:uncharacterized protein B0P05DRAFT_570147 [Gilbertella persicaria]KAI8085967.1 hypothetical protein B0P05DRAFT_570147 [Gilbertella persicaria]
MRPVLYPVAEELIRNKKQLKLKEGVQEQRNTGDPARRRGQKRKDTFEEKRAKADARKRRKESEAGPSSRANTVYCPNHEFSIKELLERAFPNSHQRYTPSLTLKLFLRHKQEDPNRLERYQNIIVRQSTFLRAVIYQAQIFVNYYLLVHSNSVEHISKYIFNQLFCNINIHQLQDYYPSLLYLEAISNRLQDLENVNMLVQKGELVGYDQIVSSACESLVTAYSNFYVKNYKTYVGKSDILSDLPEDFLTKNELDNAPDLQLFLNTEIQPIKNRIPYLPCLREAVTTNPLSVLNVVKNILQYYEQIQETLSEEQRARLFSLFPNPSSKLRFTKIDRENIDVLFHEAKIPKENNESQFSLAARRFFDLFDFTKLKIHSLLELQQFPRQKGKMFLNSLYTDGYNCRVNFARNIPQVPNEDKIVLELSDFNQGEIDEHFNPCFLDPNRNSPYVAYYGENQVRKLSSKEYYSMSGSPNRSEKKDQLKTIQGLKKLETRIPIPKTSSVNNYEIHVNYVMTHLPNFFGFYSFRTASIRWRNYLGRQCALDEAVNILLSGGKKHNPAKRKRTKSNWRKRKKMFNRRNPGIPHLPVDIT